MPSGGALVRGAAWAVRIAHQGGGAVGCCTSTLPLRTPRLEFWLEVVCTAALGWYWLGNLVRSNKCCLFVCLFVCFSFLQDRVS